MKKRSFQLTLAFILSAMLHVGFIAHLSGVEWFEFARLDSDRMIDVDLSSERPLARKKVNPSAGEPAQVKQEERSHSSVEGYPAENIETSQPQKAVAAQPDISASGSDNPIPPAGGDEVKAEISPAAEGPADGEKTEEEGPLLMTALREKFLYDISWSGIHVGQAMIEAFSEKGDIRITSRVRSASVISFFYKVEDFSESSVVNGLPAHFRIRQHEGKYRSDKATVFDGRAGTITFYNYLNNTMEEHTTKGGLPWDVLSGFYYLRTMPLAAGQTVYVNVFDSGKFLRVAVNVVRKEKVEVRGVGVVDTVMVRLLLTSEGLFKSQGDVSIWLTDDGRRIPVRVQTKVPIGSVTAELSSMERGS